jgi:hypothetical protein
MFDINTIKVAKNKAIQNYDKINKDLEDELSNGMILFRAFAKNHSVQNLKKAMEKFFYYIEHKKNKVEPFFYIAFSAYLLGDKDLAEKYLGFSKQIAPDYPILNKLTLLINKMEKQR